MSQQIPAIAVRSGTGVSFVDGPESFKERSFPKSEGKSCRLMKFSPKGKYFAYICAPEIHLLKCSDWSTVSLINTSRVLEVSFSPLDSYFLTWEPFSVSDANPKGSPNLHIYSTADGSLVRSFVSKKQIGWEPQWTGDEKIFGRMNGTDVEFYESGNFERHVNKISGAKVASFSLSGNTTTPFHVATFSAGSSGQPAFVRVYEYPKFDTALGSRSFFQGDRVDYSWNPRGNSLLLMSYQDVDKTGGSYYGKQSLHYLDTKGNSSTLQFSKEGPVCCSAWSPAAGVSEYCVIYGNQPAKTTLFNPRGQPVYEFGTGPKNAIYFSPDGSLLLGGFGNLSQGMVDIWKLGDGTTFSGERGATRTASFAAPNTTLLQWDPRSETFLTATTTPRLRTDNGWKVWHFTGALLHKQSYPELYDVSWQTGNFPPSNLANSTPTNLIEQPQQTAKQQAYRPPGARGLKNNFKLHDDEEAPHKPGQGPNDAPPSKSAIKQRKKREAKKARKADEQGDGSPTPPTPSTPAPSTPVKSPPVETATATTGDPEKDKKIKNLNKKLADIAKLKEKRASGVALEINQQAKVGTEKALLAELAKLKL